MQIHDIEYLIVWKIPIWYKEAIFAIIFIFWIAFF